MSAKDFVRKSVRMTREQWDSLDDLARENNSLAKSNRWLNKPSWRVMLEEIADRKIKLVKQG